MDEKPEIPPERRALVEEWCSRCESAEDYWAPLFKRMRDDMRYAKGLQWGQENMADMNSKYTANITLRHLRQRVAALYAKNPKVVARMRKRMDFTMWDGDPQSLTMAAMATSDPMMVAANPVAAQQAVALMQDYQQGMQEREQLQKIGRTLECLFDYFMIQGQPVFKTQLKQLIVRVLTCGVGYIKLGFQRTMERSPDLEGKLHDFVERLSHLERLVSEASEGEILPEEAQIEEARQMVESITNTYDIILREGLVFDFPKATHILVDPACTQLKGFMGARWIAHKFLFEPERIEEIYKVDICEDGYTKFDKQGVKDKRKRKNDMACVYEIYDSYTGHQIAVCLGYPDFLREPAPPDIEVDGFWPVFPLTFNDVEDDDDIIPPSDVMLLRSMQNVYNESREALREHRDGNRPGWVSAKGALTAQDKERFAEHAPHELLEFDSVLPGTDVRTVLMPKPTAPIDPALYEVESVFIDVMRSTGSQEANLGGTAGATATETSIAESSRMSSIASSIDDLDDFLSQVARASSEIMLANMSQEKVKEIVGRGAVWPQITAKQIVGQVWLEVKAGSSGRPNKAQDVANFERLAPTMIQIPGIKPKFLAEEAIKRLDDALDLTDAFDPMMQAVVAQNANKQQATGDPQTDPNAQGGEGGNNASRQDRAPEPMGPKVANSRF